MAVKKIATIF